MPAEKKKAKVVTGLLHNDNNMSRIGSYTICILWQEMGCYITNRKQEVA